MPSIWPGPGNGVIPMIGVLPNTAEDGRLECGDMLDVRLDRGRFTAGSSDVAGRAVNALAGLGRVGEGLGSPTSDDLGEKYPPS
jgi:hypothetical protein